MPDEKHKLIAPRTQTPSPGAREQTGAGRLPEELISEQVRRLAVFAAVGAGLWTYGLVMDTVIYPLILEAPIPWVNVVMAIVAIVTSVALFLYVPIRVTRRRPRATPVFCTSS